MFGRPHMAGLNEFLQWFVCLFCVVALVVRRKQQASEFELIRGYTIKQLNTLIVTPIIYSAETKTD